MDSPRSHDTEDSTPSAAASAHPSSEQWRKRRRVAAIQMDCCRTCRLRKVKCSGNPGTGPCSNCSRLELGCSFVPAHDPHHMESLARTTPSHSHTEAGTLRKRAQRACSQCHTHKTKCSGDLPKCKRCETYRLACEYTPARRKFANVRPSSPKTEDHHHRSVLQPARPEEEASGSTKTAAGISPGPAQAAMPPFMDTSAIMAGEYFIRKDIILTHFDAYLRCCYWLPCLGFLHPEMTYQAIQDNCLNPAQAAAICALSSFFVDPSLASREFGQKCSMAVESHIYQNINKFSQEALVLLALSIPFHLLSRSFAKVWQCVGVASRLMIGLQLNWDVPPPNTSFIEQESLRRVAWHLFHVDRLLAGGYEEYVSCRSENMKIRLPCNESAFRENRPVVAERLQDPPGRFTNSIGLHGIQIRLNDLKHRIQVVTKRLATPRGGFMSALESSKVMANIGSLQTELTRLHAAVPDDLRLSDLSISRYARSEQWVGFVYFHTHISACYSDLYAFSLPGYRDPSAIEILRKLPREFLARSQKQAVAHALCLARFFDAIRNETARMPRKDPLNLVGDCTITYMATQCIQVLLIAMQYNLYHNLADHTAPLWRAEPVDEAKIRDYIRIMMEIAEPWTHLLAANKEAFESSKIAVEYFDKTRRVVDRSHPDMVPLRKPFKTLGDMPMSDWWMDASTSSTSPTRTVTTTPSPQQPSVGPSAMMQPSPLDVSAVDVELNADCGPPGLPHFLAQARGSPCDIFDFAENQGLAMDGGMSWGSPDLEGVLGEGYPMVHSNSGTLPFM
ncbi:putative transcriptional regulatory protein [Escovopsis weberi]|uniref:Putative transcriptional regulatory protein n=1 Tax=Escovopsis weberi TaxID=150374 RepID=A0A0M9VTG3_ESCWE|nr:putative transcriptional regulatory protein [Escovopsis weberi]